MNILCALNCLSYLKEEIYMFMNILCALKHSICKNILFLFFKNIFIFKARDILNSYRTKQQNIRVN